MLNPLKRTLFMAVVISLTVACDSQSEQGSQTPRNGYVEPSWEKFRSIPFKQSNVEPLPSYRPTEGQFVFADLKYEQDQSLAERLLGQLATRIVFIDRHEHRWRYYDSDEDPIDRITLFSRPESWGSAFGICRSERYEVDFSDDGSISSVDVSPRYGVEGPIFQKKDFDWADFRGRMCDDVPDSHTRSYFPATDSVLDAQDLAILLALAIDEAGRDGELTYELSCVTYNDETCQSDAREFLSGLRLHEVDEVSEVRCTGKEYNCFTVTVGELEIGPNPKHITIRGTTHMNEWRVDSVSIVEGFTVS